MKSSIKEYIPLSVLMVLLVAGTSPAASDMTGRLIVDISGFPSSEGYAMVALYNSEVSYNAGEASAIASTKSVVTNQKVCVVFADLPQGWYGVALYHDENGDGKMDTNPMGIPKEAYGFSNNAKGLFGRPDYKDIKFQLNSTEKQIAIQLD
jgi:uncharacterized protein (DUF2141 family)